VLDILIGICAWAFIKIRKKSVQTLLAELRSPLGPPVMLRGSIIVATDVLLFYSLLLIVVQVIASSPVWPGTRADGFPTACPVKSQNCVRIGNTTQDSYAAGGLAAPFQLKGSAAQAMVVLERVVAVLGGRVVEKRKGTLLRAEFTTFTMGFTDDLCLLLSCAPGGQVMVAMQSESRLGIVDLGVNLGRVTKLTQALTAACGPNTSNAECDQTCSA